jgi:hypothetical protein
MNSAPLWIACLLALGVACEGSGEVGPPGLFARYGYPGPWSREGATRAEFDGDAGACQAASRRARAEAERGARPDAAYRSFLECMEQRGWSRGGSVSAAVEGAGQPPPLAP